MIEPSKFKLSSRIFGTAVLFLTICLAAPLLRAQLSSASVTGIVRDSSGAVVPQAQVVLQNLDTSVERRTVSNDSGNYVFVDVPPARYTLVVSKEGFSAFRVNGLVLEVNQTATVDAKLNVSGVEQTVQVEASAELIQSSTAELGAVVAQRQVNDLPLNGRNFTQLLSLTPGAAPINGPQQSNGFGNTAQNTAYDFPSINGQTNRSNFFMTDGLNNQGIFASTYVVPPIIDAIQEFKINSHDDQAEFGGSLGGIINVVTKSGTNEYHGTAYEYLRNTDFNARNTFNAAVTPFHQNQYGTTFGGPVWIPKLYNGRNKTFFFFGYESFRYSQNNLSYIRVPTAQELAGNFSGPNEPAHIYDPYTTVPDGNGSFTRSPYANNMIPASELNPQMVKFAQTLLPKPVYTGVSDRNAFDADPTRQSQDEYTGRIDQNLGTKNFFWARYSNIILDQVLPNGLPGLVGKTTNPGQNYGVSYVRTFSPSLVMQLQYGRSHQETNRSNQWTNLPSGFLTSLGFAPNFVSSFQDGAAFVPNFSVANAFSSGESHTLNPNEANIHQYKGDFTWVRGSHTIKFGAELNGNTFEQLNEYNTLNFDTPQTSNPDNSSQVGSAIASFVLGLPTGATIRNVHEKTRWGGVIGAYVEDSWKATQRLTLNAGLRYDLTLIPPYGTNDTIGKQGGIETGDLNLNNGTYIVQVVPPSCASRGHAPCIPTPDGSLPAHVVASTDRSIAKNTYTNFGPRFGLAYRVDDKTAIRGGFGIFYDNWAGVVQTAQNIEGSWPDVGQQIASNLNVPNNAQLTPSTTAQNPFPGGNFPAATPFNQVQWFYNPNNKNPYSMQWNFGIQRQFNASTVMTVNYVGSGTRREDIGTYQNIAVSPGPGIPQTRAPYPYIHPTIWDTNIGKANYEAMQVLLNKRFTSGLAYSFSYTWSKAIDDGASDWYGNGTLISDPNHYQNSRSPSYFDLTHVFSMNVVYEVPFGVGKRWKTGNRVADYAIGGWQLNTISTARSGQDYSIVTSGDIANNGNGNTYETANLVGNPNLANSTRQAWFNTAAFQKPAIFTFGSLGRDVFRSQPFWNIDLSIFRKFPFTERQSLEFRAEAFNVVNTVIYGIPSNNTTSSNFGQVTGTANSPRTLQLGLKLFF